MGLWRCWTRTRAASEFWYGPGRERIRQLAQKSTSTTENTLYVGGLYEKLTRTVSGSPSTEHVHYVRAGGQSIAVVKRESGALQTRYLHRDHLGSVVALSDTTGAVIERYSYDPWGKRRDPSSWVTPAPGTFGFDPTYGDRGYTGHEHIDHLGLVNMNGRIYDPELGKFLSGDPTTQFPESTQGWNRYAYTGNNPLSYIDPSGFSFLKTVMQAVGIVLQFIPGFQGWSLAWWQSMMMGFASGFLASGGDLRAGMLGAMGGALFGAIGGMNGLNLFERALLHGLAGGTVSAVGGGKFGDGFLGSFAGAAFSPGIEKAFGAAGTGGAMGKFLRVTAAAVVGGVSSALGGGKFKNGAVTAAFGRLFNAEGHPSSSETQEEQRPKAVGNPDGSVTITNPDGSTETRSGGTRSWRNNNPGNVRMGSQNSPIRDYAIGEAGGFAVFPDYDTGRAALSDLLSQPYYSKLSVSAVISKFAPPIENNTAAYEKFVTEQVGVSANARLSSLSAAQFTKTLDAIQKIEGWKTGTVTHAP